MPRSGKTSWSRERLAGLGLIAVTSILAISGNSDWTAPPRFDGAGYAVLAQALVEGDGYRAIDHPDRPRHTHFPPGYPSLLAFFWWVAGDKSVMIAHLTSAVCSVGATVVTWWWYRGFYAGPTALLLGLALAINWLWTRTGSMIQSEPLYLLLSQATVLVATRACANPVSDRDVDDSNGQLKWLVFMGLGVLLGSTLLTRHVAIGVALGIMTAMALGRQWRGALVVAVVAAALLVPWVCWITLMNEQSRNQMSLIVPKIGGLLERFTSQLVFYVQRIPDQVTGPFVEVGTVFQRSREIAIAANLWAAIATAVVLSGWAACLRRGFRWRLAGLVPIYTLGILIFWPFTEAGRFLIPLIPYLLIGALEGLARLATLAPWPGAGRRRLARARWLAAAIVLFMSLPYSAYVLVTGRARTPDAAQQAFDDACDWIGTQGDRPGPVLTRHPGEVFWRTGRQALEVTSSERPGDRDADDAAITQTIDHYRVAFLLVDRDRYVGAVSSPLARYALRHQDTIRNVWKRDGDRGSIEVYGVELAR